MSPAVRSPKVRRRRKHDLLLASALARGQAALAFDELADRADGVAAQVLRVRGWFADPVARHAGAGIAALALGAGLRRVRLLRWGVVAWRLWRLATPLLVRPPARR